jgi:hypothetical protein
MFMFAFFITKCLSQMDFFSILQNRIHETMMQDLERKRKRQDAISKRTKAQQWGVTGVDEAADEV